ncbi:unnamed protein product [marine sediment metagenome]|uniref:Uncharacterized protein n=1 Tax=marine sediment metagenome TaxID=412755 RepID=X1T3J1_9ZZZZ
MIETILLDEDILGMCNSINNNIELTTDSNIHFTAQEIVKITNCLQQLHQDYTKEEIIALAQKVIIENVIYNG